MNKNLENQGAGVSDLSNDVRTALSFVGFFFVIFMAGYFSRAVIYPIVVEILK